jgi:hypothetical protein
VTSINITPQKLSLKVHPTPPFSSLNPQPTTYFFKYLTITSIFFAVPLTLSEQQTVANVLEAAVKSHKTPNKQQKHSPKHTIGPPPQ